MAQKMSKKPRRKHSPAFKTQASLAALAGDKTLAQLQFSQLKPNKLIFRYVYDEALDVLV